MRERARQNGNSVETLDGDGRLGLDGHNGQHDGDGRDHADGDVDGNAPALRRIERRVSAQERLEAVQDLFISRWGEMGPTWGINRTQAEIHAFLFITGQPQCTDDVMGRLNISRGNASMSLRALVDYGLIRRFNRRGERREYFESIGDVWDMFSIIAAERKRRELDPVLETIKRCQAMLGEEEIGKAARDESVRTTRQRLAGMEEFMVVTNKIFEQFLTNAKNGLNRVARTLLKALT